MTPTPISKGALATLVAALLLTTSTTASGAILVAAAPQAPLVLPSSKVVADFATENGASCDVPNSHFAPCSFSIRGHIAEHNWWYDSNAASEGAGYVWEDEAFEPFRVYGWSCGALPTCEFLPGEGSYYPDHYQTFKAFPDGPASSTGVIGASASTA